MARLFMTAATLLGATAADAQVRFEADWLYWTQNNGNDTQFLSGPDADASSSPGFDYSSGYRFTLGVDLNEYEFEGVFSQVPDWTASSRAAVANAVLLDANAPTATTNIIAVPNALSAAANFVGINDELLEIESIRAGGAVQVQAWSAYRDIELNFGTNRRRGPFRFGVGYRQINFQDNLSGLVSGVFDAVDTDDGAVFGDLTNDANDALSNEALVAAGLQNVGGAADGFDAFDVPIVGPDTLNALYTGRATNRLHGAQATFAANMAPSDYLILEGIAKAGLFYNRASGAVSETVFGTGPNDDSVYARRLDDRRSGAAFAGTLGGRAIVPLTDYINFFGGYEAVFLGGVALGGDQTESIGANFLGQPRYRVDMGSYAILHGGVLGLDVNW